MPANDLYTTTQTHTDFPWPRPFERRERPALPPLRTGVRLFCPGLLQQDVTPRFCVEDVDCMERRSDEDKRIEKKEKVRDDGCVLMDRKKAMMMNKDDMRKFEMRKDKENNPKTTYQTDYVLNDLSYDDLMEQVSKGPKNILKRKCRGGKYYLDPIPFKKKNDKKPLIG